MTDLLSRAPPSPLGDHDQNHDGTSRLPGAQLTDAAVQFERWAPGASRQLIGAAQDMAAEAARDARGAREP